MANYVCMYEYVNKQNCQIWGTEIMHAYIEKPTHPKRESLFGANFGPEANEQEEAATVNGYRYRAMLN